MASQVDPPSPRPRRRWGRWVVVILAVLVAVVLIAAAVVQVVLWTDIPRDIVARQLERELGVEVELTGLRARWNGQTALEDLRLTLPLADEPFLSAPSVRVAHTGLIRILIGQPLEIDAAVVDQATLVVRQSSEGGWNLEQLGRRPPGSGGGGAPSRDGPDSIDIPDLDIHGATLVVIDGEDRRTTIEPVAIRGRNRGAFGYDYQAAIPERVEITGEINLRSLAHTAQVRARSLEPLVQPLVAAWPAEVEIDAQWRGVPRDGGMAGTIDLSRLRVGENAAFGRIDVAVRDGGVVVQPRRLKVDAGAAGVEGELIEGRIAIDGDVIAVDRLRAKSGDGIAEITGQWRLDDDRGELEAIWDELALPRGVVHSGVARIDLRRRLDGQQAVTIALQNSGRAAGGGWEADLRVEALGRTWEQMEWTLTANHLDVGVAGRELDLDGLTAVASVTPQRIRLDQVSLQQVGLMEGEGEVRLDGDGTWWVYLHGRRIPLPDLALHDAQIIINAWGDRRSLRLDKFYARIGDLQINADGHFSPEWETPVVLKVSAFHPTPAGLGSDDDPPLRGGLEAEAFVIGSHQPMSLTFEGEISARDLQFRRREIGDVQVAINGEVLPNLITFKTTEGQLLGGRWRFMGRFDERRRRMIASIGIHVADLPLAQVGELLDFDGMSGRVGGDWVITLPQRAEQTVAVAGEFKAVDLAYAPVDADAADAAAVEPKVRVERATGRMVLSDRRLRFEDVELTQADGLVRAGAAVALDQPRRLNVDLLLREWEVAVPNSDAAVKLTGTTDLLVDLERFELAGPIDMDADIVLEDQPAGRFSLSGRFSGRGVELPDIHADLFGGRAWGRLTFDIDRPLRSTGTFQFANVQSDQIVALWPGAQGLEGIFDGLMHLRPAQPRTRPVAPLRLSGYLAPDGPARFKHSQIGDASFDMYLDTRLAGPGTDKTPSLFRVVLDSATIHAFDGRIDLWGRVARHRGGHISSQLNIEVADLRLNQIMQTIKEDDRPTPGRIDGSFTLLDNPFNRQRAFGTGSLRLRDSELGNIRAFEFLYNLMNIGIDTRQPSGTGSLAVRLEGQTLLLTQMSYFNRGTEIRAIGQFSDIWKMGQARAEATIVGIGRPFRDLDLPFMPDVDDIFSALQRNATTIRVSGTIDDPDIRQATLDEIAQGLRGLFFGEIRSD